MPDLSDEGLQCMARISLADAIRKARRRVRAKHVQPATRWGTPTAQQLPIDSGNIANTNDSDEETPQVQPRSLRRRLNTPVTRDA